jgi:hypothetical protein
MFAALQDAAGGTGSGKYNYHHRFAERYAPGTGIDLEAAYFAFIRDEPPYHYSRGVPDIFLPGLPLMRIMRRDNNIYAHVSQELAKRNGSYTYYEWLRLGSFNQHREVRDTAQRVIQGNRPNELAMDFYWLSRDIEDAYHAKACKPVDAFQGEDIALPPPLEVYRAEFTKIDQSGVRIKFLQRPSDSLVSDEEHLKPEGALEFESDVGRWRLVVVEIGVGWAHRAHLTIVPEWAWNVESVWRECGDCAK